MRLEIWWFMLENSSTASDTGTILPMTQSASQCKGLDLGAEVRRTIRTRGLFIGDFGTKKCLLIAILSLRQSEEEYPLVIAKDRECLKGDSVIVVVCHRNVADCMDQTSSVNDHVPRFVH